MATYDELMDAARRADAANDAPAAKRFLELAREAKRGAASPAVPTPPPGDGRFTTGPFTMPRAGETPDPPQPPAGAAPPDPERSLIDQIMGVATAGAQGVGQGVGNMLGAPVDLINNAPRLLNLLPGVDGVGPITENPVGGSQDMRAVVTAPRDLAQLAMTGEVQGDYQPQNMAERFAGRIGQEIGASAVPVAGALGAGVGGLRAVQAARAAAANPAPAATSLAQWLQNKAAAVGPALTRNFVEPALVNPIGLASREAGYAVMAGTGAQAANEMATSDGEGTFMSDLLGSLAGTLGYGTVGAVTNAGRDLVSAVTGDASRMGDVVGSAVADRIATNSSEIGRQAAPALEAGKRPNLDYGPLAAQLRTPAAVEQAVPGYTADVGTRANDPLLRTFGDDMNRRNAGAANARISANNAAVDARVGQLAPTGNPAQFGADVAKGAQAQIEQAVKAAEVAQAAYDQAAAAVTPEMSLGGRGSAIRSELAAAKKAALQRVSDLFAQVDQSSAPVDLTGLRKRFDALTANLESTSLNDARRFQPSEVDTVRALVPDDATGPVMAPASQAGSVRSGLAETMRSPSTGPQQERITGLYKQEVDDFMRAVLPPEEVALLDEARNLRADAGRRFEEPNAIGRTLAETGRGQPALNDEAVPGQFKLEDRGNVTDYKNLLAEVSADGPARAALADQVLADASRTNALRSPDTLKKFLGDRSIVLGDFPEVRAKLEAAGVSRAALDAASATAADTTKRLSPGGPSPVGQYTKFDATQVRAAIGTAWKSPRPAEAVRELLATAGDTPATRQAARAALWEEVKGTSINSATDAGAPRWNARNAKDLFNDPRFSAVAEELWRDNPEDLAAIKEVFTALEAATPGRTVAPGSSGTAQALANAPDPALSATSVASRLRSVNRGQLSPMIALVDLGSTYLRRRAASGRAQFIDQLTTAAINNPGLAADLLEKFNPADMAAKRAMITQKYGARIGSLVNAFANDQENQDEDMLDAIGGEQ